MSSFQWIIILRTNAIYQRNNNKVLIDYMIYDRLKHDDHPQLGGVIKSETLWFKSSWSSDGLSNFSYRTDGLTYHPFGTYHLSWGYW